MSVHKRFLRYQGKVFGLGYFRLGEKTQLKLLGRERLGTVVCVKEVGSVWRKLCYSPYGSTKESCVVQYNGERVDACNADYALGNGYRSYTPVLMRFRSPDSWSPFGAGGINAYGYCSADPMNNNDPSGHMSGGAIAGIILGSLGIIFSIGTLGAGAPLTMSACLSLVFGMTADVMGIASSVVEDTFPQESEVFGWIAFSFGLLTMTLSASGPLRRLASRLGSAGNIGENSSIWTRNFLMEGDGIQIGIAKDYANPSKINVTVIGNALDSPTHNYALAARSEAIDPQMLATRIKQKSIKFMTKNALDCNTIYTEHNIGDNISTIWLVANNSARTDFRHFAPDASGWLRLRHEGYASSLKRLFPGSQIVAYSGEVLSPSYMSMARRSLMRNPAHGENIHTDLGFRLLCNSSNSVSM